MAHPTEVRNMMTETVAGKATENPAVGLTWPTSVVLANLFCYLAWLSPGCEANIGAFFFFGVNPITSMFRMIEG